MLTFPAGRFQPHDEDERARYATYALDRRAAGSRHRPQLGHRHPDRGTGARVVVPGGLNDTVQAATQILLGPPGSEIGTAGFREADQGNPQRLWNLARLMPAGDDNSRINQGRHELIDHILVSADLVQPLDAIHVEAVIDQPLVETVSPARRNILTRAGDRRPGTGRTLLQLPNGGG